MDEVTVKKADLLAKLKDNREKHIQLYKDAMEGYYVQKEAELTAALEKIRAKKNVGKNIQFTKPLNHQQQYDEAIAMLEMSVAEEITLRRREFTEYVQDTWVSESERNFMRTMALSSSNSAAYL